MVKAQNWDSDFCDLFLALPSSFCTTVCKSLNPSASQFTICKPLFFQSLAILVSGARKICQLSHRKAECRLHYIVVLECHRDWVTSLVSSGFQVSREEANFLFQNLSKTCYCALAVKTGSQMAG